MSFHVWSVGACAECSVKFLQQSLKPISNSLPLAVNSTAFWFFLAFSNTHIKQNKKQCIHTSQADSASIIIFTQQSRD